MARKLLKDVHPFIAEILEGQHDEILDQVAHACKVRLKSRFRKGQRVKIVNCGNPEIEGREGVIVRVNQKTIAVGCGNFDPEWEVYDGGDFNVPPSMLEVIVAPANDARAAFAAATGK